MGSRAITPSTPSASPRRTAPRDSAVITSDLHPAAAAFVGRLMQKPIPASYGQSRYHAEHAFRFTAADGTSRFGRYHFRSAPGSGGVRRTPDAEADPR